MGQIALMVLDISVAHDGVWYPPPACCDTFSSFVLQFVEQVDTVLAACTHKALARSLFSASLSETVEELVGVTVATAQSARRKSKASSKQNWRPGCEEKKEKKVMGERRSHIFISGCWEHRRGR